MTLWTRGLAGSGLGTSGWWISIDPGHPQGLSPPSSPRQLVHSVASVSLASLPTSPLLIPADTPWGRPSLPYTLLQGLPHSIWSHCRLTSGWWSVGPPRALPRDERGWDSPCYCRHHPAVDTMETVSIIPQTGHYRHDPSFLLFICHK